MASKYQKRHYEDVAKVLSGYADAGLTYPNGQYGTMDEVAQDFANLFAADNPLFNAGRFLKACGLEAA